MTTVLLGAAVAVLLAMNTMFVVGMYTSDNSRMDIAYGPALAWAGVKHTGRGATLSRLGYEHLTRPKSFHLRHAL